jgi:hypothetical protein
MSEKYPFHSDNQSVVEILNSWTSLSERAMTLVRHIAFWSLLGNFHIKAQFIPGFTNVFSFQNVSGTDVGKISANGANFLNF